jgi:Rps23 Pro-64 3,4-dihydroxylase Tpa1-like proline 4-hydroxylase
MQPLLELNDALDLPALAREFERMPRLQVRNVLTRKSADALAALLAQDTPWGLASQAGASAPPRYIRTADLAAMTAQERDALVRAAMTDPDYGYVYHSYPLVTAYLECWRPGSPHDRLLEELNGGPMLDFMRRVSGIQNIVKMDGQATLYGPGDFLRPHNDEESQRGRRIAYVLNLTMGEWQPYWGGYLNFFDPDWNVEQAFRPNFNCLNLFRVPQWHSVGEVSPAAPLARYAITGWARDR